MDMKKMNSKELADKLYQAHYEHIHRFNRAFKPFSDLGNITQTNWIEFARTVKNILIKDILNEAEKDVQAEKP